MRRCVALGLLACVPAPLSAATIHVPADQPTIQAGVNAASEGDSVVVACGTYPELNIVIPVGLVLRAESPACVTIDLSAGSDGALRIQDLSATVDIVGFRFHGATGTPADQYAALVERAHCRFTSCEFSDNAFRENGSAVVAHDADLEMTDCGFDHNESWGPYAQSASVVSTGASGGVLASSCVFEFNTATTGYGFGSSSLLADNAVLDDCQFRENTVLGIGSVIVMSGPLTATGSVFIGNHTSNYRGGAIDFNSEEPLQVEDCTFRNNSSHSGGSGILAYNSKGGRIAGCSFENHSFTAHLGAHLMFFINSSGYEVADCSFRDNPAGAVWLHKSDVSFSQSVFAGNARGILIGRDSEALIDGCTIVGNVGTRAALELDRNTSATVRQSILAFNDLAISCVLSGPLAMTCTDMYGNDAGEWTDCAEELEGLYGNFSADPLFCDPGAGDYALRFDSPCAPGPTCGLVGALPVGCGLVSIESRSWGAIKALYR